MINNAKPRRATQTAIIAPSQAIAFPPTTTTHREHAQQQIGTHAPPTEHEEIPEICPKRNGKKKMRREPYERNRTPTADPSEARGNRGRMGSRRPLGVAGIAPDGARAAPEVAGTRKKKQAPRFGFLVGCGSFFFPTSILLAFCCAACVSPAAIPRGRVGKEGQPYIRGSGRRWWGHLRSDRGASSW